MTITTTQQVTVDIELPAYFKEEYSVYRINEDETVNEVSVWPVIKSATFRRNTTVETAASFAPTTAEEYEAHKAKALEIISKF